MNTTHSVNKIASESKIPLSLSLLLFRRSKLTKSFVNIVMAPLLVITRIFKSFLTSQTHYFRFSTAFRTLSTTSSFTSSMIEWLIQLPYVFKMYWTLAWLAHFMTFQKKKKKGVILIHTYPFYGTALICNYSVSWRKLTPLSDILSP